MLDQVSTYWFTRIEAAAYARVSLTTLDRWARDGKITRHRTPGGRGVRYTKTDIDNAMTAESVS
jgi:excisionase family DNA binding protein